MICFDGWEDPVKMYTNPWTVNDPFWMILFQIGEICWQKLLTHTALDEHP